MKPSSYRERWNRLQERDAEPEQLSRLANRIALSFLDHYYYDAQFHEGYIQLLCEMATHSDDEARNRIGSSALFGTVIEQLCDDFEELQADAYNRVMSHVIDFCRKLSTCAGLDHRLDAARFHSRKDLFQHASQLRSQGYHAQAISPESVEKIFVLSRITIGADVAIASVAIQRLHRQFPEAKIFVLGGAKLQELFGACETVELLTLTYPRRGGLLSRIQVWEHAAEGIPETQTLVVDIDSRITQLGVLPINSPDRTLFFDSRLNTPETRNLSMSELTNFWMDALFGPSEFAYPKLWLDQDVVGRAQAFAASTREKGCRRIIGMSLGTGGNARKAIGGDFSPRLVKALLEKPDTLVLLDRGGSEAEHRECDGLLDAIKSAGHPARDLAFEAMNSETAIAKGLVVTQSGIGEAAALIGQGDEFIGYDSACQHVAAALGVPAHIIFAGSNQPRFVRRWRGCGRAPQRVVHVDTLTHPVAVNVDEVIDRLLDWRDD